jgi:hypothetical protein
MHDGIRFLIKSYQNKWVLLGQELIENNFSKIENSFTDARSATWRFSLAGYHYTRDFIANGGSTAPVVLKNTIRFIMNLTWDRKLNTFSTDTVATLIFFDRKFPIVSV